MFVPHEVLSHTHTKNKPRRISPLGPALMSLFCNPTRTRQRCCRQARAAPNPDRDTTNAAGRRRRRLVEPTASPCAVACLRANFLALCSIRIVGAREWVDRCRGGGGFLQAAAAAAAPAASAVAAVDLLYGDRVAVQKAAVNGAEGSVVRVHTKVRTFTTTPRPQ